MDVKPKPILSRCFRRPEPRWLKEGSWQVIGLHNSSKCFQSKGGRKYTVIGALRNPRRIWRLTYTWDLANPTQRWTNVEKEYLPGRSDTQAEICDKQLMECRPPGQLREEHFVTQKAVQELSAHKIKDVSVDALKAFRDDKGRVIIGSAWENMQRPQRTSRQRYTWYIVYLGQRGSVCCYLHNRRLLQETWRRQYHTILSFETEKKDVQHVLVNPL